MIETARRIELQHEQRGVGALCAAKIRYEVVGGGGPDRSVEFEHPHGASVGMSDEGGRRRGNGEKNPHDDAGESANVAANVPA